MDTQGPRNSSLWYCVRRMNWRADLWTSSQVTYILLVRDTLARCWSLVPGLSRPSAPSRAPSRGTFVRIFVVGLLFIFPFPFFATPPSASAPHSLSTPGTSHGTSTKPTHHTPIACSTSVPASTSLRAARTCTRVADVPTGIHAGEGAIYWEVDFSGSAPPPSGGCSAACWMVKGNVPRVHQIITAQPRLSQLWCALGEGGTHVFCIRTQGSAP